jgi:putative endonuclease
MFYAYLLANRRNGALYAGSTDDLRVRVEQHKRKHFGGFTARYGIDRLVWFESHPSRDEAFLRERQIKEWRRLRKIQLIEARNPNWLDLYADLDRLLVDDEVRGLRVIGAMPQTPLISPLPPAHPGGSRDPGRTP